MKAEHSLRGGVLVFRNSAIDGFGRGLNNRGLYRFGTPPRPAIPSPTSCWACRTGWMNT